MTNIEHHEYLCGILTKLVPCDEITSDELKDLASALGIRVEEFYGPKESEVLEVIEWRRAA